MRAKLNKGALSHYTISEIKEWFRDGREKGYAGRLTAKDGKWRMHLFFINKEICSICVVHNPAFDDPDHGKDKASTRMEFIDLSNRKDDKNY